MTTRPQINIPGYGVVEGIQAESKPTVAKFLNIPYATVVERWRPAVKPAAWSGVRDCSVLGSACPQPFNPNPLANLTNDPTTAAALAKIRYSEEHCLNMNIYAPLDHLTKAQTLVPVMVWIHGGGFTSGSNSSPATDGTNFVARSIQLGRPVVLVMINYRLNYLGFMSSKELFHDVQSSSLSSSSPSSKSVGNWGLLDQRIALEWVRDHIHVFGGNSDDVTAFGESAGSTSIAYHLVIPEHHGLFQRAIMQSGAMNTMAAGRAESEGQRYFEHLCKHFKLDEKTLDPELGRPLTGQEILARLKSIPATELVKAGDRGKIGMFIPTIDEVLIHSDPRVTVHDTTRYDPGLKSVMIGDCRDEGQVFVPMLGARNMKRWDKFFSRYCPPTEQDRKMFEAIYGIAKNDKEARQISAEVLTDAIFLYPNYETSLALMKARRGQEPSQATQSQKVQQKRQNPGTRENITLAIGGATQLNAKSTTALASVSDFDMVRFHFNRPLNLLSTMGFRSLGAFHASEIPYIFGSDSSCLMLSADEKALSQRMMDLWILFAWGETSRQYGLRHGQRSLVPRDAASGGNGSDGGLWQEALVFSEDCTVKLGQVERLDQRKVEFWERYEQYTRQRRAEKHAAYIKQIAKAKLESESKL
ncbi:hypothetical protein BGZ79_003222 [Entomortierella chlamydospora]|nr:hypothetical protein BGZ79_003222 [Entomortierella chlamydospora]